MNIISIKPFMLLHYLIISGVSIMWRHQCRPLSVKMRGYCTSPPRQTNAKQSTVLFVAQDWYFPTKVRHCLHKDI